ncbi:MAG: hypothetical protein WBW27_16840, partial [Pseudolabrys sp.]
DIPAGAVSGSARWLALAVSVIHAREIGPRRRCWADRRTAVDGLRASAPIKWAAAASCSRRLGGYYAGQSPQ